MLITTGNRLLATCFAVLALIGPNTLAKAQGSSPGTPFPVTFSGGVADDSGHPLAGVTVEVVRDGRVEVSLMTDSGGRFRAERIPVTPGIYLLRAILPGFAVTESEVTVSPGQVGATLTAHLSLRVEQVFRQILPPPPPPPPPPRHPQHRAPGVVIKVFFVTDRSVSSLSPLSYGPRRAADLAYGRFDVSVPKHHHLAKIERPTIWRLEFSEDPNKHFVIVARKREDEREFYLEASKSVGASAKKEALVFIHGFNVTFEDAVYRTAQLTYDLEFPGAAILYSWPSNGELADYIGDLNNNDWTVSHLKTFLESVANRTGAKVVHLIAHSMGNRALSNALSQIAAMPQGPAARPHFRQVILTAPDIDTDTFKALARSMASTADRITLYASSSDKALRLSKTLNGDYPRAGDAATGVVLVAGIDSVDASAVDTDFIGHGYYGDNSSILSDLYRLIAAGSPPSQRRRLQEVKVPAGTYWRFEP